MTVATTLLSWGGIGYLLGSIPFGLVLCYLAGYGDIRKIGSGNIGATNVLRTGNKTLTLLTIILDASKAGIAAYLAFRLVKPEPLNFLGMETTTNVAASLIAGTMGVLGHNFPVWLKFKGGKGVASAFGFIVATCPTVGLLALLTWVIMAFASRISSLSALTAAALVPVYAYFYTQPMYAAFYTAIALLVNYPKNKVQRNVISSIAPDMINVVMMVLGAGVLMGILNGPEDAGMSNAIAQFLVSVIPESLGRYFAVIIAVISAPGTYLLNNDAFYYGVLPPLAATAEAYGFTSLQIGFAALMGQAFHFLSPLVPFIYLLMDQTEITLAQYQGYIFRWCVGIFVIFMVMGLALGYLPVL